MDVYASTGLPPERLVCFMPEGRDLYPVLRPAAKMVLVCLRQRGTPIPSDFDHVVRVSVRATGQDVTDLMARVASLSLIGVCSDATFKSVGTYLEKVHGIEKASEGHFICDLYNQETREAAGFHRGASFDSVEPHQTVSFFRKTGHRQWLPPNPPPLVRQQPLSVAE